MNVIVYLNDNTQLKNYWETDHLKELFPGNHVVLNRNQMYDNPHIVVNDPLNAMWYLKLYINAKKPFKLIHLSDEFYTHDTSVYASPHCEKVYRNYWHPSHDTAKVVHFPLGYKMGMFDHIDRSIGLQTPVDKRKYIWSFIGDPHKSNRLQLLYNIKDFVHHAYFTQGWMHPASITATEMTQILHDTIFVPCITGNASADTFRLYEAIECGCIPIVSDKNYFNGLFGVSPIIFVDDWNNLKDCIQRLLDNDNLEQLRQDIINWYREYKSRCVQ